MMLLPSSYNYVCRLLNFYANTFGILQDITVWIVQTDPPISCD